MSMRYDMYICLCAASQSITVCARCTALRGDYAGKLKYSGLKLMLVKSAVTRLLPDQYLSDSVILFTTNMSFILSNMMKFGVTLVVFGYLALKKTTNYYCHMRKQISCHSAIT